MNWLAVTILLLGLGALVLYILFAPHVPGETRDPNSKKEQWWGKGQ